jgi:Lactate racemase N-terminal domain
VPRRPADRDRRADEHDDERGESGGKRPGSHEPRLTRAREAGNLFTTAMRRIPLLSGSRLVIAAADDDAVVLRPPPPGAAIDDVSAAVRDALRFPLEGEPLEALVGRRTRATIVVEPPALPLPGSAADPRQLAIAAVVDELERLGIASGYQTILVAGGLARRLAQREIASLVTPELARRFHGRVVVHDCEDPDLLAVGAHGGVELRVNRALVDTELVVTVTAAETVVHGGPAALLGAAGAPAQRRGGSISLLETGGSIGWELGVALERALARHVAVIGASIVLNQPLVGGVARGYPYEEEALERIARSPLRGLFGVLPAPLRTAVIRTLPTELTVAAAFGGPPSVAHAEALLHSVELRLARLDRPLDALVIGVPSATPYLPRERPNPLLVSYLGLGYALRLWREAFPVVDGGTVVLLNRFTRRFPHPTQLPYRSFFQATRISSDDETVAAAERAGAADVRALEQYRAGRSCHPLLPFRDWDGCRPALERLGAVVIAGCRDAAAARQLGFVPAHGLAPALAMARGRAGEQARIGFLLSPPYFPLRVGT